MIRGHAAPTGFAASISGWLRVYIFKARQSGLSMTARERIDRIDACASLPVGVGDDDARIRMMALATHGGQWTPGREQKAVIDGAGHHVVGETVTLNPDDFLNALAHAAALDFATVKEAEVAAIKKSTEAGAPPESLLKYERDRADSAEQRSRELAGQVEHLKAEYIRERDRRRELQSVLNSDEQPVEDTPAPQVEKRERLPAGVRKRPSGYQAYWRENGRQRQKDGFATAQEAAAHRQAAMEQVAAEEAIGRAA